MLAIRDNGFIPEGLPVEGYQTSRSTAAYPLKQIMALAADAARGDPAEAQRFGTLLSHSNAVLRYWAATGLLVIGSAARPAAARLRAAMASDPCPQVRIVAAETATHIGQGDSGVRVLADLLSPDQADAVRLQAINGLTFVSPDLATSALPTITTAKGDPYLFVRSCAIYLEAKLTGRYHPSMPVFDIDRLGKQSRSEG